MTTTLAIADRLEFKRLFARYAWALAARDYDALRPLFQATARIEAEGDDVNLSEFVRRLREGEQIPGRQDWTNQSQVRGDFQRCTIRSFGMTTARFASGATAIAWLGYYDDVLERGDDGWRFASRAIRPWSGPVLENFPTFEPIPNATPRP